MGKFTSMITYSNVAESQHNIVLVIIYDNDRCHVLLLVSLDFAFIYLQYLRYLCILYFKGTRRAILFFSV